MTDFARLFPRQLLDEQLRDIVQDADTATYAGLQQVTDQVAHVSAVNGLVGDVELAPAHISLGKVANLTPAELPLSDAATAALEAKIDLGEQFPLSAVSGAGAELDLRARSVNGNLPDPETGDVRLDVPTPDEALTWPTGAAPRDVLTYTTADGWVPARPHPHAGPERAELIGDPSAPGGWRWMATERTPGAVQLDPSGEFVLVDAETSEVLTPGAVVYVPGPDEPSLSGKLPYHPATTTDITAAFVAVPEGVRVELLVDGAIRLAGTTPLSGPLVLAHEPGRRLVD